MALTQRFFRLFQADLHGVLDRLEAPETLLKHALREMEEALVNGEQNLQRLTREAEVITRRQAELSQFRDRTDQELDLCFEADNEALTRTLLKRKLELEKLSAHLERTHRELETSLREQRAQLARNREHYENVRQKAELVEQEHHLRPTPEEDEPTWRTQEFCVRDDEVEIALLKEKQRRAVLAGATS